MGTGSSVPKKHGLPHSTDPTVNHMKQILAEAQKQIDVVPNKNIVHCKDLRPTCHFVLLSRVRNDFTKLGTLGSGNFTEVRLLQENDSKLLFAGKTFYKPTSPLHRQGDFDDEEVQSEIDIMRRISHPNIVTLHRVYDEPDRWVLVQEIAFGGDLRQLLMARAEKEAPEKVAPSEEKTDLYNSDSTKKKPDRKYGRVGEEEAAIYFVDVVAAIAYLHAHRIAHRDLKPENIFRRADAPDTDLMLGDFGFARMLVGGRKLSSYCGSPSYMAPEVVGNYGADDEETRNMPRSYSLECDLWSLGCILYLFLCGETPFGRGSTDETLKRVRKGVYSIDGPIWSQVSSEAKDLVKSLLQMKPSDRPSAKDVLLKDPWLRKKAKARVERRERELRELFRFEINTGRLRLSDMSEAETVDL
uniref:Protein kinase domain-containing protein n=1 Tax=Palpitomonas bilix TaxID=652834 RepID=A0A7S3DB17_9EUKA|mmetsp:Transcript_29964/g.77336  ORF Transcript_29964/g.77336 Transcript_29964/m.77336 type:complete len:414 (+) Transcript_29964:457-1698(+)|eukprot:CAMPEP_0113883726 /NCGR_PEP_ID=MMETSP0780_2-20120614/9782_1 /TAXON_ID=652834 /ORGANISM="Palpitomonas bilix" /LENGTH=413 /DNA_ID=CAMNT_0000871107 /DNA_START=429 /DNA_END=1670 /DNA_ORIENTATION=- /assembly_acc=CAM_ASM_000599